MKLRPLRVASVIQEELSKIIIRELEFPGFLVTITFVDVDRKMEGALVYFGVIPSEQAAAALRILNKARGFLQHLLLKKMNIKPMPEIIFKIDKGVERAAAIEKLLIEAKIKKKKK